MNRREMILGTIGAVVGAGLPVVNTARSLGSFAETCAAIWSDRWITWYDKRNGILLESESLYQFDRYIQGVSVDPDFLFSMRYMMLREGHQNFLQRVVSGVKGFYTATGSIEFVANPVAPAAPRP